MRLVTVLVKILKNNKYKVFRNLHRMNQTFNSVSEGADQEGACSMWLTLNNKGLITVALALFGGNSKRRC